VENSLILGLDISTLTIGYSILDQNRSLLLCDFINLSKCKDVYEKIDSVDKVFNDLKQQHSIDHIAIEDIMSKFVFGGSRISTIIALAKFNMLVTYRCYCIFGIKPEHINVLHARKLALNEKVPKGVKAKDFAFEKITARFNLENLFDKNKNKWINQAADVTDSIVISLAYIEEHRNDRLDQKLS